MQENSITLTEDARDAFRLDAELKQHADTVVGEMIEVGRCLKEINDRRLYQYLDTATFAEYAKKAVGLEERAAYNYIKAYKTYGEDGLRKYGEIGITKLVQLAQLNETDRAEMLESGQAAEISSRELDKRIRELKGENDQLRFELDDAEKSAKNNAEQIAELKKQLEEAQRPVVASMTDEEKDEVRREAEKAAEKMYEAEIEKLKQERADSEKKAKEAADKKIEKLKKEHEKALKEQEKSAVEQSKQISELKDLLDAANVANADLQARAKAAEKPAPTGSQELVLYCLGNVQQQWEKAIATVAKMEPEERAKLVPKLSAMCDKLKAAAEGVV